MIASLLLGIEPADSEDNDEAERDTIRLFDGCAWPRSGSPFTDNFRAVYFDGKDKLIHSKFLVGWGQTKAALVVMNKRLIR